MKKKSQTKRLLMAVALTAAACEMTTAQVVVHEGGYNDALIVPGALTVDGKARITLGRRSSEISIYNKNFEKEASITPASNSYRIGSITQEATVKVTGAAFKFEDPFQYATIYTDYNSRTGVTESVSATSLEEGLEKLKNIYLHTEEGYSICNIGGYSFIKGNVSSYYESFLFGTQYPASGTFLVCKDGYLYTSSFLEYVPLYNESSAVWTTTDDRTSISENSSVAGCRHVNADEYSQIAHSDNDEQLVCTQNFFNDDEEWEYVQYTREEDENIFPPTIKQIVGTDYIDGTVILSRSIYFGDSRTGIRVLNQSGNVVLSMNFPTPLEDSGELDLWTINGKSYIQIVRSNGETSIIEFYEIDKGTSNVRKVLEYEVPAEERNEDATIYDLSGRVLTEKPANGYYIQGGKKYLAQ